MGKYLSVLGGIIAIILGILGLVCWWDWFVHGLQAIMPAILVLGGIIALFAGVSEIKDSLAKKEEKKEEKK